MLRTSLACLALLALAGSAAAADPRCARYGEGFVYSDAFATCFKVSGSVEAGYRFGSGGNNSAFGSEGKVILDTRTDTGLGPLRLHVEPKIGSGGTGD